MFKMHKILVAVVIALGLLVVQSLSALACGGLLAPNGAIRLARATTLVAWHDGIEHYMTSFSYQGNVSKVGWIVPLPTIPLKIEEGGDWTLQRLFRETHPIPRDVFVNSAGVASAPQSAKVIEQVKIKALNITVLQGSGQEIINWANSNGFQLNDDTRANLFAYAKGSPIFMAAQYDTSAAQKQGLFQGDGTPILITMKTTHLWVPLAVLATDGQDVQADLYLLTDTAINTSDLGAQVGQSAIGSEVPGAPGFKVASQEKMNDSLYHDLSTDRNMSWVRSDSWLTYMTLDAPYTAVTYDLGISATGVIRLAHYGTTPMAVVDNQKSHDFPSWLPRLPMGTPPVLLGVLIVLAIGGTLFWLFRPKKRHSNANSKGQA